MTELQEKNQGGIRRSIPLFFLDEGNLCGFYFEQLE